MAASGQPDNWRNIAIALIMALRWALERYGLFSTVRKDRT
jgi:hypothetical protein